MVQIPFLILWNERACNANIRQLAALWVADFGIGAHGGRALNNTSGKNSLTVLDLH
jgi:hypothetical protein